MHYGSYFFPKQKKQLLGFFISQICMCIIVGNRYIDLCPILGSEFLNFLKFPDRGERNTFCYSQEASSNCTCLYINEVALGGPQIGSGWELVARGTKPVIRGWELSAPPLSSGGTGV